MTKAMVVATVLVLGACDARSAGEPDCIEPTRPTRVADASCTGTDDPRAGSGVVVAVCGDAWAIYCDTAGEDPAFITSGAVGCEAVDAEPFCFSAGEAPHCVSVGPCDGRTFYGPAHPDAEP